LPSAAAKIVDNMLVFEQINPDIISKPGSFW
jgi:hypothetical protein